MGHSTGRLSILWLLGLCLLLFKAGYTEAQGKRSSRVTSSRGFGTNVKSSSSNGLSFDCPEEFGYYPHPTDCTQYYVCVFGGALLESCTGGLMYSHELQTCDWPRNVGCELVDTSSSAERVPSRSQAQTQTQHVPSRVRFGSAFSSPGAGASKAPTVAPQYHRSPPQVIQAQVQHIPPPPELRVPPNPVVTSRGQPKPLLDSQEDIAKLYAEAQETLPPVEEEESDRQQRVYRGQPSTVSQVQRDRDGIIHQASINAIPQAGKIGSYAFGTAYSESLDEDRTLEDELAHNRLDGADQGRLRKRRDLGDQVTESVTPETKNHSDSNTSSEVVEPEDPTTPPISGETSNSSNNSQEHFDEAAPAVTKPMKYSSKISQPKNLASMEFDYQQVTDDEMELEEEDTETGEDVATGESKRRPRQLRPVGQRSSKWPGQNYRAIDAPPPAQNFQQQQSGFAFGNYNPYLTPPNPASAHTHTQAPFVNHNYNQLSPGYQAYLHQAQQVAPAGPLPQQKAKVVYTGYNLSLPPPPVEDDFRPIAGSYYGSGTSSGPGPASNTPRPQHSGPGDLLPYLIQQLKDLKERRKQLQAENFSYFHLDNQPVTQSSSTALPAAPSTAQAPFSYYSQVDPLKPSQQQVTPNGQYSTMGGFYNNQQVSSYPGKLVSQYSIGTDTEAQRSTTESSYFQYNIVANQKMKGVFSSERPNQIGHSAVKLRPPVTPVHVVSAPNLAFNRHNSLQQVPFRDFSHLPVGISYASNSTMPESYQTFTKSISTTEPPSTTAKSKLTNFQFNVHEFMANLKNSDLASVNPALNPLIKYFKQVSSDGPASGNGSLRNTLVQGPSSTSQVPPTTASSPPTQKPRIRTKPTSPTATPPTTTTRALKGYESFIKGIQKQLSKQTSSTQTSAPTPPPTTPRVTSTTTLESVDYYDEDYEEDEEDILPPSQMPPYMPMSETMAPPRPQMVTESPGKLRPPNFQTGFLEATTTRRPFPNFSQLNQPNVETGVPSFISFPSDIFQELKQRLPQLTETSLRVTTTAPRITRPTPTTLISTTPSSTTRGRFTTRPRSRGQQKWMTSAPEIPGSNKTEIESNSKHSSLGGLQLNSIHTAAGGERHRVESSSPSSLGAPPPPANIFVQPTPQAQPQPQELSRNYYNASIFNHGSGSGGGYQQHQQQQVPQHQQQLQPTPFQQAQVQQAPQQQPPHQQQQAQAPSHPYDSSYYSIYDDDIDLYRDIEYQQQQQQDQRDQQQQQQPPPAAQYQPVVRQQQTQSTYRPIELSATPTPPQKASYGNQPTLVYSTDYDEDVNAQIEQDNVYDQPTRSPPRPEQVAIQRLATPSSAPSSTTPAARPDIRTYYDTLTTPDGSGLSQPDYSYSSSAEYAYGSPEDYDQSEATLTRTKPRSEADDYDLSANVVGPTGKSATAAPTRAKNSKSTPAIDRSPTKSSSFPTTQAVKVTKPTTTTTTTTTTSTTTPPPSTTTPKRNNNRNRGSAIYTNQDRDVVSTPNRGTHPPRTRPTLKPSGTIVSKAQEFVDIYRNPPSRPDPIYPQPTPDKTAAKCRKDVCLLPDCYCGGKDIPGELPVESIPQIVLLTFDDSVNDLNKQLYTDLFEKGRVNPNGCPITATFYVSHEWTDYSQVQNLYADGHEMASHTVSHSFGEQFSQKKWTREIAGQREILAAYGGVKLSDVRGMRAPFLSVGGNKMYKMLYDSNFTYDSSMPVYENRPPSWPYTLDYKIFHDCMIPPCPTRSYPGVWQVPMVMWQDLNGGRCSMGDACSNPSDAEGVTKMIMKNFERHYTTNRAPFGLFYHAAWFTQPHHKEGFIKFLDAINAMPDVWIVTNWQALQWVRDPTPISRINSFQPFQCDYSDRPKRCNNPKVCNLWHKSGVRYMKTCQPCPDIYPWTGKSGIRSSRIDNEVEEPAP
ncbi:mucin-4 isoform X6 [Drosophila bipectinata]|uniref:mucin-4 isoform X6 n=1 Tax=Drosophila bipectinata TaxID=42026 RepID=UPI0038B3F0D6